MYSTQNPWRESISVNLTELIHLCAYLLRNRQPGTYPLDQTDQVNHARRLIRFMHFQMHWLVVVRKSSLTQRRSICWKFGEVEKSAALKAESFPVGQIWSGTSQHWNWLELRHRYYCTVDIVLVFGLQSSGKYKRTCYVCDISRHWKTCKSRGCISEGADRLTHRISA